MAGFRRLVYFKRPAFTLAEVLITLGIIGVVAAITIPNIINNVKAHRLKTAFWKSYSVLAQTIKMMEADDVSTNFQDYLLGTRTTTFAQYLTNATICPGTGKSNSSNPPKGCYVWDGLGYRKLSKAGYFYAYFFASDGDIILPSGSLIFFSDNSIIAIDVNGIEKPNRLGYDLFLFEMVDEKLYPMGNVNTKYTTEDCNLGASNQEGKTCAQKALTETDYFKTLVRRIK